VFALPGVPAEMTEMWVASVRPAIREWLGVSKVIAHYRLKCFGVGESDLEAMLPDLIARQRYPLVGITVSQATITLRITAEGETAGAARAAMQPTIETIRGSLGDLIYGEEEDELQDAVVRLLRERKKTLAVVEWGTTGLVSRWLAECGAADVFRGGSVRTNDAQWSDVVLQGKASEADYLLAVGPRPEADSPTSQPGNIEIVLCTPSGTIRKQIPFSGHPEILKPRAAKQAINLLRLHLLGKV
jgi:nicotinamide-nucleotide amidase